MDRQEKARSGMLAGVKAGHAQARLDKRLAVDAAHAADVCMMPLDAILSRVGGLDTREPTEEDLDAMVESIDALGLVEPLAVDKAGHLLCGKTRLVAIRRLAEKDPDRWAKVPVRRMDFDAEKEPARGLAVEVAENEKRRGYTAAEVRALAERLQAAGFRATPGRPRKGTKALLPALGAVVGKSKRTLLRILEKGAPDKKDVKKVPFVTFSKACARLRRVLDAFEHLATAGAGAHLSTSQRLVVKEAAALAVLLTKLEAEGKSDAEK